jgi:hypothetical protein
MCKIFSHFGAATVVLDYTDTFSVLGYGLFGLLTLSCGMIVYAAIRHHFSQTDTPRSRTTLPFPEYRKAA